MSKLPPRVLVKSRSAGQRDERQESVYNVQAAAGVAPVIRTYMIQPPIPSSDGPAAPLPSPSGGPRKMHDDSSQIQNIMNPILGPRDAQVRAGIKPPDHAKSNISAVKEQSSLNHLRKMAEKVNPASTRPNGNGAARSTSAPTRKPLQRQASGDGGGGAGGGGGGGRDFLQENRMGAAAPVRLPRVGSSKGDDGLKYLKKPDFGRVPTYLLERKIELIEKQEADVRAKEAALIPPGMRLLGEDERLETLTVLQKNRQDIERALQGLPLRIETPGQIRRRDELERRLKEIEEGLRVFARPKVLVRA